MISLLYIIHTYTIHTERIYSIYIHIMCSSQYIYVWTYVPCTCRLSQRLRSSMRSSTLTLLSYSPLIRGVFESHSLHFKLRFNIVLKIGYAAGLGLLAHISMDHPLTVLFVLPKALALQRNYEHGLIQHEFGWSISNAVSFGLWFFDDLDEALQNQRWGTALCSLLQWQADQVSWILRFNRWFRPW